jgi:hypothetical protein
MSYTLGKLATCRPGSIFRIEEYDSADKVTVVSPGLSQMNRMPSSQPLSQNLGK